MSTLNIGLTICGRARWKEAEATRKNTSIVLIHQDKKLLISELFKVIHHEFRIDIGRTKFEPETDGILHVCGSFEQGTHIWMSFTSKKVWMKHQKRALDRHQTCSKERILYDCSSLLDPEGDHDGNWRNHIRESFCV